MALLVATAELVVAARSTVCMHIWRQLGVQVSMFACRAGLGLHVQPCPCWRECGGALLCCRGIMDRFLLPAAGTPPARLDETAVLLLRA